MPLSSLFLVYHLMGFCSSKFKICQIWSRNLWVWRVFSTNLMCNNVYVDLTITLFGYQFHSNFNPFNFIKCWNIYIYITPILTLEVHFYLRFLISINLIINLIKGWNWYLIKPKLGKCLPTNNRSLNIIIKKIV